MPKATSVDRVYQALLREGKDQGSAARIAQAQTGLALATGKKPKHEKVLTFDEALRRRRKQRRGHPAIVPSGNIDTSGLTKGYPEYDPSQPRSEDGTWSSGGGSGSAGSASVSVATLGKDLGSVTTNLSSISSRADALASIQRTTDLHDKMKQMPPTAWRDPTALDHAWRGYLTTVASLGALAAVTVVLGAAITGGVMFAGAHTTPLHSAAVTGLMAAFPKGYSTFSYTAARRFLSTLFPKEAVAARTVLGALPMVGAGLAGIGAVLATALALRYAYRQYETEGRYEGVSSVNRRIEMLDYHIESLRSALTGAPSLYTVGDKKSTTPYIQAGLAIGSSLVGLVGAAKLGQMAYRASKLPSSGLGAFRGWGPDISSILRGFGADIARAKRGTAQAARSASTAARRRPKAK